MTTPASAGASSPRAEPFVRATSPSSPALEIHELYRVHAPFIWRCLRRLGVAEADVADLCQETFLRAHAKLDQLDGTCHPRTWLYGIAQNKARDYRRSARRREAPTPELPDEPVEPNQLRAVAANRARQLLDALLDELDEVKREAFMLFELEGLPMGEVAELAGCPLQTAYARLHAARRILAQGLRRRGFEGGGDLV